MDLPARRLGGALREHRKSRGNSLDDISRRLDFAFTPVVLHMVECGEYPLEEPQVQLLLWGYDVTVQELIPERYPLELDESGDYLAVGWTVREIRENRAPHGLLNEYLAFVYELRGAEPGSAIPLRDDDLAVLSNTIDWPTAEIRNYLVDLMFRWRSAAPLDTESEVPGRAASMVSGKRSIRDTCGAGSLDC